MKKLVIIGAAAAAMLAGCHTVEQVKDLTADGMWMDSTKGRIAIGSVEVLATPQGEEAAVMSYAEDTAWLSPSTKTRRVRLAMSGTNTCARVDEVVGKICEILKDPASENVE